MRTCTKAEIISTSTACNTNGLSSAFKHSSTKTKEWEEVKKTRAKELAALADAIKLLNNDDALELFKNTFICILVDPLEIPQVYS